MKRALDIVAATVALVGFAPALAIASALIWLDDGGPVLFVQERIGREGVRFRIYKLRTMRDGEVTWPGHWLRQTGIDEVPQFINVLRGEMSVVGPRPLTAADIKRLGWGDDPVRLRLTPGITGPAQVFGVNARGSLALDHRYAEEAGVWVDLELIAVSFAINLFGKQRVRAWLSTHRYAQSRCE